MCEELYCKKGFKCKDNVTPLGTELDYKIVKGIVYVADSVVVIDGQCKVNCAGLPVLIPEASLKLATQKDIVASSQQLREIIEAKGNWDFNPYLEVSLIDQAEHVTMYHRQLCAEIMAQKEKVNEETK